MENAVAPNGNSFAKGFSPLRSKEKSFSKGFFINCLKEKYVYKITKDFPLTSTADSHNSVVTNFSSSSAQFRG